MILVLSAAIAVFPRPAPAIHYSPLLGGASVWWGRHLPASFGRAGRNACSTGTQTETLTVFRNVLHSHNGRVRMKRFELAGGLLVAAFTGVIFAQDKALKESKGRTRSRSWRRPARPPRRISGARTRLIVREVLPGVAETGLYSSRTVPHWRSLREGPHSFHWALPLRIRGQAGALGGFSLTCLGAPARHLRLGDLVRKQHGASPCRPALRRRRGRIVARLPRSPLQVHPRPAGSHATARPATTPGRGSRPPIGRLGVGDLRNVAEPGAPRCSRKGDRKRWPPRACLGPVATHAQPGFDERPDEPRPHGALMVRAIALPDAAPVGAGTGLVGRQRAQAERRQQSALDLSTTRRLGPDQDLIGRPPTARI